MVDRYTLETGGDKFRIDSSSGQISTHVKLDREEKSEYELIVVASDSSLINPRTTRVNVTVVVLDANDNSPFFSKDMLTTVYVPDNTIPHQFVFGARAIDADIGLNSKIVYHLSGEDAAKFNIKQDSGVIKATSALSGPNSVYRLEIRATDSGINPLSSAARVEIKLRPADQFPVIRSEAKTFTFSEQVENRVFTTVSATSPKSGPAGEIRYGIAGGNTGNVFHVNSKTGEVSVGKGLDYEMTTQYELWVEARDSDNPPLASVTRFLINVTDHNDNTPVFDQLTYNATILEEQFPPQLVLTVRASDLDSGRNSQIVYQLRGNSDAENAFTLDAESGKIFTNAKLDREETAFYTLMVEAIDQGSPQRTGTATVSITVADKNDNPPRFTRLFSVNVTENAAIGTFVIQVSFTPAIHPGLILNLIHIL